MDHSADILACMEVVTAFCDATDAADATAQVACFTDDAVMAPMPGMEIAGKAKITEMFSGMAAMNATRKQRHVVSNLRVRMTGADTATATALLSIYHFAPDKPLAPSLMVDETNDLRRVDGVWLIARKTGSFVAGALPGPPGHGGN